MSESSLPNYILDLLNNRGVFGPNSLLSASLLHPEVFDLGQVLASVAIAPVVWLAQVRDGPNDPSGNPQEKVIYTGVFGPLAFGQSLLKLGLQADNVAIEATLLADRSLDLEYVYPHPENPPLLPWIVGVPYTLPAAVSTPDAANDQDKLGRLLRWSRPSPIMVITADILQLKAFTSPRNCPPRSFPGGDRLN